MVFSSQMVQIEDLKPRRAATVRYWTASCFGTACCQLSFTWIKIWCSSDMKSWRWRSYWVGPWNTRGETKPWDIIGFSGPSRNLSSWITHQWSSEKTLMFMASASQILRGRRCRWNMIGETKMIKEKHITTISIICLNSTVLIYQFQNNTKRQWCFFFEETHRMCFSISTLTCGKGLQPPCVSVASSTFGGSEVASDLPKRWSPFFLRQRGIQRWWNSHPLGISVFIKVAPVDPLIYCWFVFYFFFYQIRQIRSCSLQFPGRGSESCLNSWGASYSRSRIRFEVMSPEATPKNPTTVFLPQNEVYSNIAFPKSLIFL